MSNDQQDSGASASGITIDGKSVEFQPRVFESLEEAQKQVDAVAGFLLAFGFTDFVVSAHATFKLGDGSIREADVGFQNGNPDTIGCLALRASQLFMNRMDARYSTTIEERDAPPPAPIVSPEAPIVSPTTTDEPVAP
ncbi:MAG: hypothetical protein ACHREM_09000 [Polyangiales bacterium]